VIEAFERYITAIYADRFDTYSGEQLQVLGEQRSDAETVVMTRIVDSNGEPQNLNYLMRSNGSMWQIADVFWNGTISELAIRRPSLRLYAKGSGRWADAEPTERRTCFSTAIVHSEPR
jgi:phospholipid transport system substrate-binding protein